LSSTEESEVPSAAATDDVDHESHSKVFQQNMSASNKTRAERIRQEWLKFSVKQREEMLRFEDPAIFEHTLKSVNALCSNTGTGVDIAAQFRGLPLLSSIEFEKTLDGPKVIKVSSNILQDGIAFFATLQQLCPKLFSGKLRNRSNPADWSALLETPTRKAWKLQQRIAELIEQKLWALGDVPACDPRGSCGGRPLPARQSGIGRRRAKNKTRQTASCFDKSHQAPLKNSAKPEDPVAHVRNESPDGEASEGTSTTDSLSGVNMYQRQQDACCDALEVTKSGRLPEHNSPGSITEQATRESTEAEQLPGCGISHLGELQGFQQPPGLELPESARAELIFRNQLPEKQLEVAGNRLSMLQVTAECMIGA
jgi:hypothetical protein